MIQRTIDDAIETFTPCFKLRAIGRTNGKKESGQLHLDDVLS